MICIPAVEFVGILLSGVVEVQTKVGVDADAKVVVHDEDLRVILIGDGGGISHSAALILTGFLFRMKDDGPSIQSDFFRIYDVSQ